MALVAGLPAWGWPALSVTGCGIATATAMWVQLLAAAALLRHDPFHAPFQLWGRGLHAPDPVVLRALLRLGLPIGGAVLIEVSAFTVMALFIARWGTLPLAGHPIAMNLISMMFMVPLAVGNATSTLVAQRLGAGDLADARRLGWHGLQTGLLLASVLGGVVFLARRQVLGWYSAAPAVQAAALSLRAWRIATVPMVIYATCGWGLGLGGGYQLAFNVGGHVPLAWQGAPGFWLAATAGLVVAGGALTGFMHWVQGPARAARPAG